MSHIIDKVGLHLRNLLLAECEDNCVEENHKENESECENGEDKNYCGINIRLLRGKVHYEPELRISVGEKHLNILAFVGRIYVAI